MLTHGRWYIQGTRHTDTGRYGFVDQGGQTVFADGFQHSPGIRITGADMPSGKLIRLLCCQIHIEEYSGIYQESPGGQVGQTVRNTGRKTEIVSRE